MRDKYYVSGSTISYGWGKNIDDISIKCTCEHCGYKFNQTKEHFVTETLYSYYDIDKKNPYIEYTFNDKCPNCGFNSVKDNRKISADKRKKSMDLTQKITDSAVRLLRFYFNNSHVGAKEIGTGNGMGERVDAILFSLEASFLIETKISRDDFLKDAKKEFRKNPDKGMGDYRYYACPEGLIKPEELPEKWGLIYVDDKFNAHLIIGYKGFEPEYEHNDPNKPKKRFMFNANLYMEKDLLISLCKRYKTKTGTDRLI